MIKHTLIKHTFEIFSETCLLMHFYMSTFLFHFRSTVYLFSIMVGTLLKYWLASVSGKICAPLQIEVGFVFLRLVCACLGRGTCRMLFSSPLPFFFFAFSLFKLLENSKDSITLSHVFCPNLSWILIAALGVEEKIKELCVMCSQDQHLDQ